MKKVSFEGDVPEREDQQQGSARICYLEEDAEVELTFEVRFHQFRAMNFFYISKLSHISIDSPLKSCFD